MHDVGPVAHHVRRVERDERRVGAPRIDLRRIAPQPRQLDPRAQREPAVQIGHDLRLPRAGVRGRVVEVEVVLVLPRLDVRVQVAFLPPGAPAPGPDAESPVLEKVLVALGGEAQERLGAPPRLEARGEQAQRALVDLGGGQLQAGIATLGLVDHTGRRRVPEVAILRADHRRDHLAHSHPAVAADPADRRVRALEPRRTHETEPRDAEEDRRAGTSHGGGGRGRRDEREPQALNLAQVHEPLLDGVGAKRNAVQPPARSPVGRPVGVQHRDHAAVAHVETVVADREHEAHEALPGADSRHRVELEVAVQVFGVHEAVVPPAAGAEIPEAVLCEQAVLRGAAQRQRVHHDAQRRVGDAVGHAVGKNALIGEPRVPGVRDRIPLGVESPPAHEALAVVRRVPGIGVREGLGDPRERVLEHRAEVHQQRGVVGLGGPVVVLPHPHLDVLDARQVDAGGRESLRDRAPARAVPMRADPTGRARPRVREAQHRVGVQHQPERRLGRLRLAHDPDRGVDLLRQELDWVAGRVEGQALPGQGGGGGRIESRRRDPERLGAARGRGDAPPMPAALGEGDEPSRLGLEFLHIGLAGPVRAGTRQRSLRGNAQQRRDVGVDARQLVQRPREEVGLEMQLRAHAADEARGGLEAEGGPGERALLVLEQPGEGHLAARAEVVPCREAIDRRGRDGKRGALLELGAHLGRAALEQRVGVLELHLPAGVVDGVVHVPREQAAADGDLLAPVTDLEAVEGQRTPVGRRGHVGLEPQREHRGGPLARQEGAGGAIQRVVALGARELGRVGEGLEVREHDEVVPQRCALARITGAREEAVVLVEPGRVRLEREPEPREVGLSGCDGPLALVHRDDELHGLARDLAAADAVGAADLEAEAGRARRHARLRIVDQSKRVDQGRVGVRRDRERADAASRAGRRGNAARLARRDVGDREVVALVKPRGEREPAPARVHVVVLPLLQDLPLEGTGALRAAVHGPARARAAGHRPHAADVLVAVREWREGPHPIDVQAPHAQGIGEARRVDREDVHGRVARDQGRIDREEEPARFVVQVARDAINRLGRRRAHIVDTILDDVPPLLGVDPGQLERAELRRRLHAEVVRGDGRGDEAGGRSAEGDVPGLDALQDVVLESLIPDLQVVVGVELPAAVEIHVHVQPLAHDAAGAHRVLRHGTDRRESSPASRDRLLPVDRRARQIAEPVRLELEAN